MGKNFINCLIKLVVINSFLIFLPHPAAPLFISCRGPYLRSCLRSVSCSDHPWLADFICHFFKDFPVLAMHF